MRTNKIAPEDVNQKLFELFCKFGYDGTSLELLSEATGLKKASLYHRFPKGKIGMAQHVLKNVEQWIVEHIINVLKKENIAPNTKLKQAIASLKTLYDDGNNNCLLRTLSVGSEAKIFQEDVIRCFDLITEGFKIISLELGSDETQALEKARMVNPLLQGSLVLSGATGDITIFKNCLTYIADLMKPAN